MPTNGDSGLKLAAPSVDLPPERAALADASIKSYVLEYHQVAEQRDILQQENFALKEALHLSKITCEAQTAQLNEAKSQTETALLLRDQAMARCAKWETLYIQLNATMRAFVIPHAPLIKDTDESVAN